MPNTADLGALLRSPLHDFALETLRSQPSQVHHGVHLSELPHLGCLVLRGRQGDAAFMNAAAAVLGAALPTVPSTFARCSVGVAYWMSPDEWWVLCPRAHKDRVFTALGTGLQSIFSQVVDNSGGLTAVRITGSAHLTLLRHMGPYDFDSIEVGEAISTVAGKANVTVLRTDPQGVVVLFRRSFADYFWRLLDKTARPYGVCIVAPQQHADPFVTPLLGATHS